MNPKYTAFLSEETRKMEEDFRARLKVKFKERFGSEEKGNKMAEVIADKICAMHVVTSEIDHEANLAGFEVFMTDALALLTAWYSSAANVGLNPENQTKMHQIALEIMNQALEDCDSYIATVQRVRTGPEGAGHAN